MSVLSISTHSFAKELLNKPDSFLTVTANNREYIIDSIKRKSNCANSDDWYGYYTIICKEEDNGGV